MRNQLLEKITTSYLDSRDFNGLPFRTLEGPTAEIIGALRALILDGLVHAQFPSLCINPAIVRLGAHELAAQLAKFDEEDEREACFLYPTRVRLNQVLETGFMSDQPYRRLLALGESQLAVRCFDLAILEVYRNDPRYHYSCDDIHGYISISDEHYESDDIPEHDQVLLETFGFAYDEDFNRGVATFVCYLAKLSPEHQQMWRAKELGPEYRLHPDFFRTQVLGDFPEDLPVFTAFIMEMKTINAMAEAMARPKFFREVPSEFSRPRRFGFLVRPTQAEFNDFVLLLDKLLSDNINKKFFGDEVPGEVEETRKDGKVMVRPLGTIQMLTKWFDTQFRMPDRAPLDEALATLRKVRKLRQKPAHRLEDDKFDQEIFRTQRELVIEAYRAVRMLRLCFANHPACKSVEVNDLLYQGKICTY